MNKKVIKIKHLIGDVINEHNNIWKDISISLKGRKTSTGYNCFNLKEEEDIIVIAAGLVRKGIK